MEIQVSDSNRAFNFSEVFSEQSDDVKKLFEEIAILQTAVYLNNFPAIHVTNVTGKDLAKVSVETVLHATIAAPYALKCLAKLCGALPCQLKLLTNTLQIRAILNTVVDKRTSSHNEQGSMSWYNHAKKKTTLLTFEDNVIKSLRHAYSNEKIDLTQFFDALLDSDDATIKAFTQRNFHPLKTMNMVKGSKLLKEKLSAEIIGQDAAINSLSKGYLSSTLKPSQGPRLIYTFAGPSGVGKTYSAHLFSQYLKEIEGSDYIFTPYNMESYADEKDAMMLFGSGSQYTDSALGNLTTSVRNYPRQVILFDEIEKAHHSVITSLLSLLDSGIALDTTEQTAIDFSQCIIIFTSNLGQEVFVQNKTEQSLNVFEILKNAKHPTTGVGFSPELVNRLAKGYPVIFNTLKMNHLIRLAEHEIAAPCNLNGVSFNFPDNFSSFLLQSISPDISVRRLQSTMAKFQADVLVDACVHIDNDIDDIVINVEIDDNLQTSCEALTVLIIDEDDRLVTGNEQLTRATTHSQYSDIEIHHCINTSNLRQDLRVIKPDVILLDIEVVKKFSKLHEVINQLIESNKHLAIFTYLLHEPGNEIDIMAVNHEIREHFNIETQNLVVKHHEQFDYMLERVRYYLNTEQQVKKITQRHQMLKHSLSFTKSNQDINVKVGDFSVEQMVFSEDLTNSRLFDFSLPDVRLDDVIGLTRAKSRLTEVLGWMKQPEKLARLQVGLPTGFLFSGPPGTGKTLLAKAVAGECQLPFFSVSAADLSSQFSGGTTENIKQLFERARKYAPAIIFIDEIDAIGRKRHSNGQGDSNLVVNTLLTEMDGFNKADEPVFILAATNFPEVLDSALTRPGRFDETIMCDLPNKQSRQHFLDVFINKHQLNWRVNDLELLVKRTQGLSSAELEQVLRESLYQSLSDETLVTVKHVNDSITRISYGLPSESLIMSKDEKQRTAYHETGHLLAYKLLFPNLPVDFITIIPRDQALGFVATGRPDKYNGNNHITISNHLQVMLAGRVAEKILHGGHEFVSTGASSDIQKATSMAMNAIFEGGLSEEVGAVNLPMLTKYEESDLLHTAQKNVRKWLLDSEQDVEALLQKNVELLNYFAKKLLIKESMYSDEINAVIADFDRQHGV